MILHGEKTWEMRKTANRDRGIIGLVRKGSGRVVGVANLVDSLPPISVEDYSNTEHLHGIRGVAQRDAIERGYFVPWVLKDVRVLPRPVPYKHKFGAQSRIVLEDDVAAAIHEQLVGIGYAAASASPNLAVPPQPKRAMEDRTTAQKKRPRIVGRIEGDTAYMPLSDGNITHNHFYLRSILDFFPEDSIGGSDETQRAKLMLTVQYVPGTTVRTDISGPNRASREKRSAHYFFRERAPIKTFFARTNAQAGDTVVIRRDSPASYTVTLDKAGSK